MNGYSEDFRIELERAGWTPDRKVDTAKWRREFDPRGVPMPLAADEFLSRFGGLSFEWRRGGVDAHRVDVELDPGLCAGEEDGIIEWGQELGKAMFPLGEIERGRHLLAIDEDGMIYRLTDGIAVYGRGAEGLKALLTGVLPEILPLG